MIVIKLKSKKSQQLIRAKTENITRTQSENKKIAWSRETQMSKLRLVSVFQQMNFESSVSYLYSLLSEVQQN